MKSLKRTGICPRVDLIGVGSVSFWGHCGVTLSGLLTFVEFFASKENEGEGFRVF